MPEDYDRLRLLWPDHLGLARGKYLPGNTGSGSTGHCLTLFTLGFDRVMTPHDGAMFWKGLPDLEATFDVADVRPGWEPGTGVVIPEISRGGEMVPFAPRNLLKSAIEAWTAHGITAKVGIELEAFLFEPDDGGGWKPIGTPGHFVYGTGMAVDPTGVMDKIMSMCREVGFPLEAVNSEYDNGQFELTLTYDEALTAADNAFLFKVMAREIAAREGYLLSFMGKPINGRGGSGFHINLSLHDDEGNNLLADSDTEDGLSEACRSVIAGMLHHHVGMTALLAPTVNAYKRLRPGSLCGYWANWGYDHRGVTVRVPPVRGQGTRLEHRVGDGSVNPHQAIAAVLTAARLGFEKGYPLPDVETLDCIEQAGTDIVCPPSLEAALDELENDTDLVEALSPAFVEGYVTVKRAEWDRYKAWTTDWELNEYLPFL